MSDTYTKLFSSITESTVWGESYATRIVWVTLLAMADANGNVYGAIPGLARRANVSLSEVEGALHSFLSPDPYSRTRDDEGRRIVEIDGGWQLINHAKYGAIRNVEERREYKRQWDRNNRTKGQSDASDSNRTISDKSDSEVVESENPTPPTPTPTQTPVKQKKERAPAGVARPTDVPEQLWADWLALRKAKRAPVTQTVLDGARREAQKAGLPLTDFLGIWCRRGSQGLEADWLKPTELQRGPTARHGPPGNSPPAQASKTLSAIQQLQAMKHGNASAVDPRRDSGRAESVALLEP